MSEPRSDRPEPTGCTLGDLMALTLGVAIAATLDWYSTGVDSNLIGMKLAPAWFTLGNRGVELVQKCCLALIPVILARRWRYGGPLRPVECLPILTGAFLVTFAMSRWAVFDLYFRWPTPPHSRSVHPEAYYVWELFELTLGALAALIFFLQRRRPGDWIRGSLLAVAWNFLTTWLGFFYQQWANQQIMTRMPGPLYVAVGSIFLVQWPQLVLGYLPMMIAIIDLYRPPPGRRTWVVWAAVAVGFSMPVLYEARIIATLVIEANSGLYTAIRYVAKILALLVSFALARWSEPTWRWLLGGTTASTVSTTRS